VLAIIRLRGGLISLSETGAALGVSPEDISESIERLELAHQIERA
jgi:DNA-binding MarR family transcriptional regulator